MPLIKPGKDRQETVDTFHPLRKQVITYLRRLLSVTTDAAVLLATTIAGYAAALYACKALWNLYLSTHMGAQFVLYFPHAAKSTTDLLQMDPVSFSIRISLSSFVICIAIASIFHLFYLSRYVHGQFGMLGRLTLCGLPLAALIATYIQPLYGIPEWSTAFVVVLIPALSVFSRCFTYAAKLLPEVGDVKRLVLG